MTIHKTALEKLFEQRKATYEEQTEVILDSISGVIGGIELYAESEGLMTDDNYIEVLATSLDPETKFVFIVAGILPSIGSTVILEDGESVEIETSDDQSTYSRTVQVNISAEIVEENDAITTYDYIEDATSKMKSLAEGLASLGALVDNLDSDVPEFADFEETTPVLSEADKENDEKLRKILEGATNKSGLFN